MDELPDPSGPPYRYEYPLPEQAKAEHLRAERYFQRKLTFWKKAPAAPSTLCVALYGAWLDSQEYVPGSSLVLLLVACLALEGIVGYRISVLSGEKRKHSNLLKAYGVLSPGNEKAALAARPRDLDRMHEALGKPLSHEEASPQPTPRKPDRSLYDETPRNGNPYSGVIRISPPQPRPELNP